MDQHELISFLIQTAKDLGRVPTRAEFEQRVRGGDYKIRKMFGSYAVLLQAAGLDTYDQRRAESLKKPLPNSIFNVEIDRYIERYNAKVKPAPRVAEPFASMAIISDIHFPFHNEAVGRAFVDYCAAEKPEYMIIDGDAWDMYSHAKFPRSHNVFVPKEEERLARELNEELWKSLQTANPNGKCFQMLGNHDVRPMKRTLEKYPEIEHWVEEKLAQLFTFNNVTTVYDPREELIIGDVMIHHGYKSRLGDHRDHALYNAIVGHTHVGGTTFRNIRGQTLWELNCGLAGNPEAKGLTYTPQRITKWTPGFGVVDARGPRFIPV